MISVSTIKSYMFCPLKLYFESNIDGKAEEDYFIPKTLKNLRMDIQDLLHKNLRHVKKDMNEREIEKMLAIGINNQIQTTFAIIEEITEKNKKKEEEGNKENTENDENNKNNEKGANKRDKENKRTHKKFNEKLKNDDEIEFIDKDKMKIIQENKIEEDRIKENTKEEDLKEELEEEKIKTEELKKEIIDETRFNLKILSVKVVQAMKILDKNGDEIQGLFFPSCMYDYLIRDIGLDLIGVIDKIEVEKGNYFPISLKSSNPPIKGVWDGDLMEVIANGLLIEQEFNTYTTVGYVDYLKIGERRAVIIDTDARKSFFKILTHINRIVDDGEIPNVKTNLKKCENCEYKELCDNS